MKPRQVAQQVGISRGTVERIAGEPAPTDADDRAARAARRIGRPQVDAAIRATVRTLLEADQAIPPGEVCRRRAQRSRSANFRGPRMPGAYPRWSALDGGRRWH